MTLVSSFWSLEKTAQYFDTSYLFYMAKEAIKLNHDKGLLATHDVKHETYSNYISQKKTPETYKAKNTSKVLKQIMVNNLNRKCL